MKEQQDLIQLLAFPREGERVLWGRVHIAIFTDSTVRAWLLSVLEIYSAKKTQDCHIWFTLGTKNHRQDCCGLAAPADIIAHSTAN